MLKDFPSQPGPHTESTEYVSKRTYIVLYRSALVSAYSVNKQNIR